VITITSLQVRTFDLDHLDLYWEVAETTEEVERYDFYVLRSVDGAGGPYSTIAGPFYNVFHFRDPDVHQLHRWRDYYYKIRVTQRESGESHEVGPQWLQAPPDLVALEIQRRERHLFQEWAGRSVIVFPKRTFGQRCGSCWDVGRRGNTIGRSTQQNCSSCFDTTFVGGYATPMRVFMQIDPAPLQPQRTDLKEHQFIETSSRTTAFPPIYPGALIVEAENQRWEVQRVSYTNKHRAVIRQELVLWGIPRGDIRFKVPVNYDTLADFTPSKAMTRPHSLQADLNDPLPDLFGE
jgi:hypothetical protein